MLLGQRDRVEVLTMSMLPPPEGSVVGAAASVPIHLVHGGQGSLPLKTRSFLDYCAPRLRAALADLLPADAAVLTGDLSSS